MSDAPVGVPTCYRHPDRETYISCQRCGRSICPDCMHEASVGFHCPACVAEGRKSVRTARTTYGGALPGRPGVVTGSILVILAVVWIAVTATGGSDSYLVQWLAMRPHGWCGVADHPGLVYSGVPESACGALPDGRWYPGVTDGAVWRLLTYVFTHIASWHLALNMIALWQLGPMLERLFGTARFLALYLLAGIAGGVMSLLLDVGGVGASGAWFGLLAATMLVAWKTHRDLSAFTSTIVLGVLISLIPGVSWQGHLGGFLGGAAAGAVLVFAPRTRRALVQTAGLAAIALVLAGATAAAILV